MNGCMTWVHECMAWAHGCMGAWVYGCMSACRHTAEDYLAFLEERCQTWRDLDGKTRATYASRARES